MDWLKQLTFDAQGLMPVVIQDATSLQVLTLCYMNRAALERTLQEGKVHVFRRAQQQLMLKGVSSGHVQRVKEIFLDCEGKSLVMRVEQHVAACHEGYFTCYFRQVLPDGTLQVVDRKRFDPSKVYS